MEWHKSRNNIVLAFFFILFFILGLRLFYLVAFQGEELTALASKNTIKTVLTDAPRGEIYDRNGVLIAGNKTEYSINLSRNDMTQDEINDTVIELVEILNRNEEDVLDDFPIQIDEEGNYYFTFDRDLENWKRDQQLPMDCTPEQAFDEMRVRYDIPEELDRFEAQNMMIEEHNLSIPISVTNMEFRQVLDKRTFLEVFRITPSSDLTAKKAYRLIRNECNLNYKPVDFNTIGEYMGINLSWMKGGIDINDRDASKILAMRYLLIKQGFMRYLPAEVAFGIKQETVVEIEENIHNLQGVSVLKSYLRYYPEGPVASHAIGYMGKIPDTQLQTEDFQKKVQNLEYRPSDLIGQYGIEYGYEDILKGSYGTKRVQVDKNGIVLDSIGEEVKAQKGESIALTIDIELQKKVKAALLEGIDAVRTGGPFNSRFGNFVSGNTSSKAGVGAIVVIDVETGEPLSLVNSDDYDPNLFARGITTDDWNSLQTTNPRDPLSRRPLYNVATSTAVQPGSTFKPMTAITGLEMGLNPNRVLVDAGFVEMGDHTYSCMAWNSFGGNTHGGVDLYSAMGHSCNFYFFDVATGRDWANGGADIGYADDIDIDVITDYAKQFGLGVRSDIEIDQQIVEAPTGEKKRENMESLLRNYLYGQMEYVFTDEAQEDKDKMLEDIDTIVSWTSEDPSVDEITPRLIELGVKENEARDLAFEIKSTYYNYAGWTVGDEFNVAIGQGETAFTPLQMANYMATIGNGGTLNSSSLLKAKESLGEVERPEGTPANIKNSGTLTNIVDSMRRVVTSGTLQRCFSGFDYAVAGKTGTAQRDGYVNPPDEVQYMKDNLGAINSALKWEDVEVEMERLMEDFPSIYKDPNNAVRRAVLNLSGRDFDKERLDEGLKDKYEDFGWVVALAPADNPEIAVACLLVQSNGSEACGPIVREVIGDYFDLKKEREENEDKVDYSTIFERNKANSDATKPEDSEDDEAEGENDEEDEDE